MSHTTFARRKSTKSTVSRNGCWYLFFLSTATRCNTLQCNNICTKEVHQLDSVTKRGLTFFFPPHCNTLQHIAMQQYFPPLPTATNCNTLQHSNICMEEVDSVTKRLLTFFFPSPLQQHAAKYFNTCVL